MADTSEEQQMTNETDRIHASFNLRELKPVVHKIADAINDHSEMEKVASLAVAFALAVTPGEEARAILPWMKEGGIQELIEVVDNKIDNILAAEK